MPEKKTIDKVEERSKSIVDDIDAEFDDFEDLDDFDDMGY